MGREEQFSYEGLKALYDYLTQLEEDCGIEIELDVIALCCEYTEYGSIKECYEEYEYSAGETYEELGEGDEERDEKALEYLQYNTQVIEFNGGIIIANF